MLSITVKEQKRTGNLKLLKKEETLEEKISPLETIFDYKTKAAGFRGDTVAKIYGSIEPEHCINLLLELDENAYQIITDFNANPQTIGRMACEYILQEASLDEMNKLLFNVKNSNTRSGMNEAVHFYVRVRSDRKKKENSRREQ